MEESQLALYGKSEVMGTAQFYYCFNKWLDFIS